ncbi:succinate dehydrogenase/fumarate reductase iron-sulfur subunit [Clostridium aminobutyricum]|uniref:succinate dehydrogenase n=1 Tax=Clostridium aminobutyricum TaxID=33953 RepID=A0A939IHY6_CLOAM|nr:2Fe-2S iron-sulfur cluster-binding protein [Clostridium aminobutyricum]MBN7774357.1 4Fe-4S dicluster domain-containing protein [Clostridium aminobutyricum]
MDVKIRIRRKKGPSANSYIQEFTFEGSADLPVTGILEELNARQPLEDTNGKPAEPIDWECSCKQKLCGACAMVINGVPRMACSTFLGDVCGNKNNVLELAPLSKFPVIRDLRIDRTQMFDDLKKMKVWLSADALLNQKELEHQYESASCILCGCCLEVCPNYSIENAFVGASTMNGAYRVATQQSNSSNVREFIKENVKNGQGHCSKSLSCEKVCPIKIPVAALTSRMNRLYLKNLFKVYR